MARQYLIDSRTRRALREKRLAGDERYGLDVCGAVLAVVFAVTDVLLASIWFAAYAENGNRIPLYAGIAVCCLAVICVYAALCAYQLALSRDVYAKRRKEFLSMDGNTLSYRFSVRVSSALEACETYTVYLDSVTRATYDGETGETMLRGRMKRMEETYAGGERRELRTSTETRVIRFVAASKERDAFALGLKANLASFGVDLTSPDKLTADTRKTA